MAKITIMFDTMTKTMTLMKDGSVMEEPMFATFDHNFMVTDEGRYMYDMRILHRSEREDGITLETSAFASDEEEAESRKYDKDGKKIKKKTSS